MTAEQQLVSTSPPAVSQAILTMPTPSASIMSSVIKLAIFSAVNVAAKLAPLMDSGSLLVEGALTGPRNHSTNARSDSNSSARAILSRGRPSVNRCKDMKLPINEFTRNEREAKKRAQELEKQKKAREKAIAAMQKNGSTVFDNEGNARYSNLSSGSWDRPARSTGHESVCWTALPRSIHERWRASSTSLVREKTFSANISLPYCGSTGNACNLMLLPYQRQGLQWMLDHESPKMPQADDVVQLWKKVGNI